MISLAKGECRLFLIGFEAVGWVSLFVYASYLLRAPLAVASLLSYFVSLASPCVGRASILRSLGRARYTAFMSVEELKVAVAQLPTEDLDRFSRWFEEFLADEWDRRIEADILAGRLMPPAAEPTRISRPADCTPLSP